MSFVGSLLGAGKGTDFSAPLLNGQQVQTPIQGVQAQTAVDQSNADLAQQQAFVNAVNAQTPQALQTQSALSGQLAQQAAGGGPNPALSQLNQSTGQNVATQAALAAGQRGASSNVGLLARQVGQQGAATQQNAAGQAATLQAQQQIAAQNSLQNLAATQVGQVQTANTAQNQAAQNQEQNIFGAINAQNQAQVGEYSAQTGANSATAIQNSKAQQGLLGGALGGAGSILNKGGMVGDQSNMAKFADGGPVQSTSQPGVPASFAGKLLSGFNQPKDQTMPPSKINIDMGNGANPVQTGSNQLFSKVFKRAKDALSKAPVSETDNLQTVDATNGGTAPAEAPVESEPIDADAVNFGNGTTTVGDFGADSAATEAGTGAATAAGTDAVAESALADSAIGDLAVLAAKGGRVPAIVSPGEEYLTPEAAKAVAQGKVHPLKAGKVFPGKPKVKGDSLKNDTIPTELEVGGIVIPNHIMQSKQAAKKAQKFVEAVLAKQGMKRAKQ